MPLIMGILAQGVGAAPVAAGAYDLLETTVLASSKNTVTFTGLGSYTDYKHLQIRMTSRNWKTTTTSAGLQINSSILSHNSHSLTGNGSSVSSSYDSEAQFMVFDGFNPTNGETADVFSATIIDILDFADTNKTTTARAFSGFVGSSTFVSLNSGLWDTGSAVTSLTFDALDGGFITGSRFSLYGVR